MTAEKDPNGQDTSSGTGGARPDEFHPVNGQQKAPTARRGLFGRFGVRLRPENKIDGQYQTAEPCDVIPLKRFVLAEKQHEGGEDDKRDYLLNHFQLPQRERPPVFDAADPVGRNLKTVFEQGDAPTQQHDGCERHPFEFRLEYDVPVPRQRHKGVGADKQQDGKNSARHRVRIFIGRKNMKKYDPVFLAGKNFASLADMRRGIPGI